MKGSIADNKVRWFWIWAIASVIFRLILVYFPKNLNLSSHPEVSTPLTTHRRPAEGYWLKQSAMSPYDRCIMVLPCAETRRTSNSSKIWPMQCLFAVLVGSFEFKISGPSSLTIKFRTYGFILAVHLSPNIGVLGYLFAEVFDFSRNFFLIIFPWNILLVTVPLAIRLNHRSCFLSFVGDLALDLALVGFFTYELSDMQFSLFLFCGYAGISLLSPVMHGLWIWRPLKYGEETL